MTKPKTMSFLSSGVFWGAVIVIFGLSIILKEVFHVSFPVFRVIIGIFLIYLGAKVIAGGFGYRSSDTAVFSDSHMKYNMDQREYSMVFGSGTVDLTDIRSVIENNKIEVNVVFGSGVLKVNDNIPLKIKMTTAFGSVVGPERQVNGFGETVYTSAGFDPNQPHLFIEANAVFGKLVIDRKAW